MRHNHKAVALAVLLAFAVGFLWYSPFAFFEPWSRGWGLDPEAMEPAGPLVFGISLAGTVAGAYVLSWLIGRLGIATGAAGAGLALLLSAALIVPALYTHYLFGGLSHAVAWIDAGNALVAALVMGWVLGAWRPGPRVPRGTRR